MDIHPVFIKVVGSLNKEVYKELFPDDYICDDDFYYKHLKINRKKKSRYDQNQFRRLEMIERIDYLIKVNRIVMNVNIDFTILTLKKLIIFRKNIVKDVWLRIIDTSSDEEFDDLSLL
jgi:hypothetical protein